jgi:predicted house-cleaning noncanonical NTP pyrophosphatase (MazG superfamily)
VKDHPGELPFKLASLKNGILKVVQNSGLHPAVLELVFRDIANDLHNQAQEQLDSFLQSIYQEKGGGDEPSA